MNDAANERSCGCGMPDRWVASPHFPVEFDERMNEYTLVNPNGARAVMRYCFWCGGKLPESKRGDFFTTPSKSEMAEVHSLLKEAQSHEDVVKVLGPPDEVHNLGGYFGRKGKDTSFARWEQHYKYTTRWKSFVVYVPVIAEGQFSYSIHGHDLSGQSKAEELTSDRQPPQIE